MEGIDGATGRAMITVAIIVDVIEFMLDIAVVGAILDVGVDFVATLIFAMWFNQYGVSLIQKRTGSFLLTMFVKLIPFAEMAPAWTYFVWKTIQQSREANGGL